MKLLRNSSIYLLLIFGCTFSNLIAQADTFNFRKATQLYQVGKFEEAEPLAKRLYQSNTNNANYFQLYKDILVRQNKLSDAVNIIKFQILTHKNNIGLKNELAGLYFDLNEKELAFSTWEDALKSPNARLNDFTIIANTMVQRRLIQRAIDIYKEAQVRFKNPTMFLTTIARLNEFTFNYEASFKTYVLYLRHNPHNVHYVRQQLLRLVELPDAKKTFFKLLPTYPFESDQELQIKADLLVVQKKYMEALQTLQSIKQNKSNSIFSFARDMQSLSHFKIADRAYTSLAKAGEQRAILGLLDVRFERYQLEVKNQPFLAHSIDSLYQHFNSLNASTTLSLRYIFHLINDRNDLVTAEAQLNRIDRKRLHGEEKNHFYFTLGLLHFQNEKFNESLTAFNHVSVGFKDDQKYVYLTTIDLLKNEFSSVHLGELVQSSAGLKSKYLNEALRILFDMTAFNENDAEKRLYAKSFYAFLTGRYSEAQTLLDSLGAQNPNYKLNSNRFVFDMLMHTRQFDLAEATALSLTKSEQADEWIFKWITVLVKQKRVTEASSAIQKLILSHPNSFWTIEARDLLIQISAT
jgi:tetratricopeptide (TPR) repeat protein